MAAHEGSGKAVTPGSFIAKWRASALKERSAAQEHFIDLCRLLGEPTPAEADPTGETYCFERGARKDTGGDGWADVWKRHHFAWEYKGKHADLDAAFNQLRQYALALENPPLLIVSDMARFRLRTNWTNSVSATHEFALDDLADAANRDRLKWALSAPERLRPGESRQALTERAAATFAALAQSLRARGHAAPAVAHFVNRLVFCMFAEDVGLLPDAMFTRMLEQARKHPAAFADLARALFGAMATGGRVGFEPVSWFDARDLSIDHPATVADYIALLSRMDVLIVQHALREDRLAAAPKKARKVAFTDPFIFHAVRSWLDPVEDPFDTQVTAAMADPEWTGKLAEACAVAHHHRLHPTFYIKGDGEVDIAYVTRGGFQPVEVKWTGQVRSTDLKQARKYPNSIICSKSAMVDRIHGLPNELLPLHLLRLGQSPCHVTW